MTVSLLRTVSAALLGATLASAAPDPVSILESARDLPVAHDVDVVVVGGTTGAVSAAVEAASKGAKVFLAAPRPYLGEDIAATLRLWLEDGETPDSPLEKAIFDHQTSESGFPNRLDFSYAADLKPNPKHPDPKSSLLADSRWATAANDSVQFDADVTLTADLGKMARVKDLHLLAFRRDADFEVGDVEVWTSPNGTLWRDLGKITDISESPGADDQQVKFSMSVKQPSRFVKILVRKSPAASRILLGELVLVEDGVEVAPAAKKLRQPPTPMQAKVALDKALLDAGIPFLYGCAATDVLRDASGNPAGIVIANRAGRQAVRAKVIIDATPRASIATAAGAKAHPFPAGDHTFQRVVVGGGPHPGEGVAVRKADFQFFSKGGPEDVFIYSLTIPMPNPGPAAFAEAEQIARGRTFDVALADESDVLFQVPPDPIITTKSLPGDSFDPASADLGALQPEGVDRLFILGGRAGLSRQAAENLLRPLAQIRVGKRVGAAAAELAATLDTPKDTAVASSPPADSADLGEVKEFLQGSRPTDQNLPTIPSPTRALPVLGHYDVVVVGGGTGGAPAAIAAGRKGAKTLLVEFQDHLGGVGTLGLISSYYHGYKKGFTTEVDQGVAAMGGPDRKGGWNPVAKREWWRSQTRGAGADIWFSTLGCGALVRGQTVVGVIVATPHGRGVVLAKAVVDSTGNTDIAVAAGAPSITTSAEHIAMQGTGLSPKALAAGYTNTDYSFSDESDPVDQWRMIVSARQKYKNDYDLSTFIDSRERRRIVGDIFISPLDIINNRTYHDTISLHDSNFDTHGYTVHPIFLISFPDKKGMVARVPYRALLPKNIDGILVTGLGISAHRDSMPILRMQACIQNQGYAAGYAAATVAAENKSPRSLDVRALQEHLAEIGSIPSSEIGAADSPPPAADSIAAAVTSVVQDYRGLALLLENKDASLPLLRQAHASADSGEHKLVYANILGMLGDSAGAATLADAVRSQSWDEGWNFRGMGQFGGSISRLDSHIIALGRSGDPTALPAILDKLAQLDATKEFSHHRAIAIALEERRDPAAAKPLADLLAKDGMTGFAITEVGAKTPSQQEQRSEPLREIILARALFRCGDHGGLGERILRSYSTDLRALFAKHAHAVLTETDPEKNRLEIAP